MIQGVTYILKTDATFQGLIGQNVALTKYKAYPVIAPQTENIPYSVCRLTSMTQQYKGRAVYVGQFQVASYARSYDEIDALDNAVIEALSPTRGTYNGVNFGYIEFDGTVDDYTEAYGGLFGRVSTFNFSITRTALT